MPTWSKQYDVRDGILPSLLGGQWLGFVINAQWKGLALQRPRCSTQRDKIINGIVTHDCLNLSECLQDLLKCLGVVTMRGKHAKMPLLSMVANFTSC